MKELDDIREWVANGADGDVFVSGVVHLGDFSCDHGEWCQVQYLAGHWVFFDSRKEGEIR